jgi:hypothetical protein
MESWPNTEREYAGIKKILESPAIAEGVFFRRRLCQAGARNALEIQAKCNRERDYNG